jgi:hypothetical protein
VPGGVLDVAPAHAGVQRGGHERMPEAVRAQGVSAIHAGGSGQSADHAEGGGFIQVAPAGGGEQRTRGPAGQVVVQSVSRDRGQRDGRPPAALASDPQDPMPPLDTEILHAGGEGLADAQPVVGGQGDQGQVPSAGTPAGRRAPTGDREHGAELVAVQAGGLAVGGRLGSAHVRDERAHERASSTAYW